MITDHKWQHGCFENVGRRLRELENEGVLDVVYVKNHAHYKRGASRLNSRLAVHAHAPNGILIEAWSNNELVVFRAVRRALVPILCEPLHFLKVPRVVY